jgi:hypothetical protein
MAPIITTLLTAGPALIRMFGQSKGGNTEFVAETIADVVERVQGEPSHPETKAAKIQAVVDSLDPAEVTQLKISLAQINASREKAVLEHDLGMHQAQQKTLQSLDIKGVRPQIANRHSWFTIAYLIGFEGLAAFGKGTGANWEIATLIAAPTLAWFGFRTWDKFSKQGSSN